jgi:hypothetical protein
MAASGQSRGHVRLRVGLLKAIAHSQGSADRRLSLFWRDVGLHSRWRTEGGPPSFVLRVAHWTVADSSAGPLLAWRCMSPWSQVQDAPSSSCPFDAARFVGDLSPQGRTRLVCFIMYGPSGPSLALLSYGGRWATLQRSIRGSDGARQQSLPSTLNLGLGWWWWGGDSIFVYLSDLRSGEITR